MTALGTPSPIPERGEQFLHDIPSGGSSFLDALIRSATHSEAQIFTEATPPFKICHANNAWSLLCGYSVPEVLGKTCKILQGPETDPERLRDLHAGIAANCKTTVQLVNYTKTAERFLNEVTIEPLLNQVGEVTHFIGTLSPVLRPASMSAAAAQLCTSQAADQLEKPPPTLRNTGEPASGKGAQGTAERGASSASASCAPAAAANGAVAPGAQGSGASAAGPEYTDLLSRGSFPPCADTYARGPPYCTHGLRVLASCALCVSGAQGSLPPGPHALYVRKTRTSCTYGRRLRASGVPHVPKAYCGTSGFRCTRSTITRTRRCCCGCSS